MNKLFKFSFLLIYICSSHLIYGQDVIYRPTSPNPGGVGSVPTRDQQEQQIAKRRGEKLKREREEAARAAEEAAKVTEANALARAQKFASAIESGNSQVSFIIEKYDISIPKLKNLKAIIENHSIKIQEANKAATAATTSTQAQEQLNKAVAEKGLILKALHQADHIKSLSTHKQIYLDKSYEDANTKLLFAQASIEKFELLKKELLDKTNVATSDWTQTQAVIAMSLKTSAGLVKSYLSTLAPGAVSGSIGAIEGFIQTLLMEAYINEKGFSSDLLLEAFKAAAYKAIMAQNAAFVPDKIISTTDDIKTWKQINEEPKKLRKHVKEQLDMLDDSIKRFKRIIQVSNKKTKPIIDKQINQFLSEP